MDELNFTLSIIGLGMDLPFDAGIVGDTAVAVLKGFSAMIPSGPAREVLLDAVKLLFDNPEGISAMAGAVWKMMGNEDLVKLLSNNPKLLKAAIESSEHADELLAMGPDAAKLVEEIGEDAVKAMLDSSNYGELILRGTNYSSEYAQKLRDTFKVFQDEGYEIGEHGLNRIFDRINNGKIQSVDQVLDVLKSGTKYSDPINGGTVMYKNGVSIHIAEDGFIKTVVGNAKVKSTWELIK
jgi:hypothetical protein